MTISVRTFLAVVTAVVGITSAAVAFAPVYISALSSVESVVDNLRVEIAARLQVNVREFFSSPQLLISSLMTTSALGGMNVSDKFSMISWFAEASKRSGLSTYAGFEDGTFLSVNANNQPAGIASVFMSFNFGGTNAYSYKYNISGRNASTNLPAATANSYNPTVRPWYAPLIAAQSWSSVYLDNSGNYAVLTVGGPFTNDTGLKFGAFAMDFPTAIVLNYLRQQAVGKTGRVMLLDRKSLGGFLGGNWEVSSAINDNGVLRMAVLGDVASSDANVLKAYTSLGLDYLLNCATPCQSTIGSGVGALFVDVMPVTDAYGLDMRLVALLPAKDFLDKMDKDSKVSIGAAVGAVVGLLIIAVVAGQIALAPLSQLEDRIYAAASLADDSDDENDGCDFLSEVANIEAAFKTLRSELARLKSFVPQSVLQRMDDDEDAVVESVTQSESSQCATSQHRQSMASSALVKFPSTSDLRSNMSKSRSAAMHVRDKRGGAVLNVTSSLTSRQVTLLSANLVGFHDVCVDSVTACTALHTRYLDIVCSVAAKNRGVVDNFSGDRVFISFNASNNVATHVTRCAATMCGIEDAVRKLGANDKMAVRLAASSGRALVGNIGNSTIKRFSVMGSVVNQNAVLLQLSKLWAISNLVSSATMETMEFEYNVEAVGIATLPSNEKGGTRMVVGSVMAPKAAGEAEEWMYELNNGGKLENDLATLKAAFQQLLQSPGSSAQVVEKINTIETTSLTGVMRLQALLKQPEQPLGVYYDALCGKTQ